MDKDVARGSIVEGMSIPIFLRLVVIHKQTLCQKDEFTFQDIIAYFTRGQKCKTTN